ncbi:ABC transporter permease [Blautia liquoris]|uniref:ABC transporter permease n=1 Tax=Blautia liquoris TaxID=2779518 RepID=A0A7M2RIH7_9FIRM|nr:ABC transporter permease [Blautia liquoris]QOV20125.1 ABC transporter permease [Blautia liquoris]
MFFKQVYRNAAKNRKGNGLFFGSLVIAIVAFYTLLSLGEQDVMRFLATIEGDAVHKLMLLLPAVYILSLFFVFFLVYFACKYQTDNRRKEFGMYLMLGMKRSRLFSMLFGETLWNSLLSLLVGLPAALFLTEIISLVTVKLVGLGIIGHHFTLSPGAILWTIGGYILVQLLSLIILCISLAHTEPAELLHSDSVKTQLEMSNTKSTISFILGVVLLLFAYYLGLFHLMDLNYATPLLLFSGIVGTFLLYRGLGEVLGKRIRRKRPGAKGLATFTGRQLQENVLHQYSTLAISSLLLLLALSCVSYGISLGHGNARETRSTDFSVFGNEQEIHHLLDEKEIRDIVKTSYPIYLSRTDAKINTDELAKTLREVERGGNIAEYLSCERVISEGSYNDLMQAMGKKKLELSEGQTALFSSMNDGYTFSTLDSALKKGVSIKINGTNYSLLSKLCHDNIVADRAITLSTALIVPDELFSKLATEPDPFCTNITLKDEIINQMGLMQAIQKMDSILSKTGLKYDSYLSGIGRNLFYTVSASYLTIYLGILFLLIANTVIGLKYLIWQRQNKHRYLTLLMLGTGIRELCDSVKKQITVFFSLVLGVAAISSVAAVCSMFSGLTRLPAETSIHTVTTYALIVLTVFIIIEIIYIKIVTRTACREIYSLETEERRDAT